METVPKQEIEFRIRNFQLSLQEMDLDGAFILQNTDLFYFSGTIQSFVLFIPRPREPVLIVQKGLQRARHESSLKHIIPGAARGQIKKVLKVFGFLDLKKIGLEMDVLPMNLYSRYKQVRFVGHGIGLEINEHPILAPRSTQRFEPGMVIALEPKFVFPDKGVVGTEDDYLVTTTGVERLTLTDQTAIRL